MDENLLLQRFLNYQSAYMDGLNVGICGNKSGDNSGDALRYRRVYEDAARATLKTLTSYLKSKKNIEDFKVEDALQFVNLLKSYISKF